MDVFQTYTLTTSAWLALQSVPLLLTPSTIINLLSSQPRSTTDVELYLSRSLALTLLAFAAFNILLSGYLPLSSKQDEDGSIKDPYAFPSVVVTTTYHAATAFACYAMMPWNLSFGFGTGVAVSGGLFCFGVWLLVFGSEKGRISKKTGADKRTGNFPFTNEQSARWQKKEGRKHI